MRLLTIALAILRAVALIAFTFVLWLAWLTAGLLGPARSGGPRLGLMRFWSRGVLWLLGGRVELSGQPPTGVHLLVSNHLSYIDVVTIASTAPCRFLSRGDVAGWPLLGPLARSTGTLFIDRTAKRQLPEVIAQVRAALEAGHPVTFFPEGTSSGGADVLPFKPSLFEVAVQTATPIHCVSLSYERPPGRDPARDSLCWWADMTFADHFFGLLERPGFRARLAFAAEPATGADRKQLAESARRTILANFTPVDSDRTR